MKKPLPFLLFFSAFILALMFCTSCKTDPKHENAEKAVEIGRVNFYLENSVSMKGYLNKDTKFKDVISSIISDYDNININLISDSIKNYKDRDALFTEIIQQTDITNGKSTQLNKIFEKIADSTKMNDVSVFVSDCILSFTKAERKNNPDASKDNIVKLRDDIKIAFRKLKDSGFVATVYAFNSPFYGKYFDFRDSPTDFTKTGTERPYYIWIIAKEGIMNKFNNKLKNNPVFKPLQSLIFGQLKSSVSKYSILPSYMRRGEDWEVNSELNGVNGISLRDTNSIAIAINLDSMPNYILDTAYLMNHLIVNSEANWVIQKAVYRIEDIDTKSIKNAAEVSLINKSTHIIKLTFIPNSDHNTEVQIKLPFQYDDWYQKGMWSCEDDSRGHDFTNKTFMFHRLVEGVAQAYDTKTDFINFLVKIEN